MCVCARVYVCVCVYVRACACTCVCVQEVFLSFTSRLQPVLGGLRPRSRLFDFRLLLFLPFVFPTLLFLLSLVFLSHTSTQILVFPECTAGFAV